MTDTLHRPGSSFALTALVGLLLPAGAIAQESGLQDGARAVYAQAESAYRAQRYHDVQGFLDEVVRMLGSSNPKVESLRALAYLEADRYVDAEAAVQRFLALQPEGPLDGVTSLRATIAERRAHAADEQFQAGIRFFNSGDFGRAAEAFEAAVALNPYSRDSLLNLVQSLYSQALELEKTAETPQRNQRLRSIHSKTASSAAEVRKRDPLNQNVLAFQLRSYRALADLAEGEEALEVARLMRDVARAYEGQRYKLSDIQLGTAAGDRLRMEAALTNLKATPGETVGLRFEILDAFGRTIGTAAVDATVPAVDARAAVVATTTGSGARPAGWRYRVTGDPDQVLERPSVSSAESPELRAMRDYARAADAEDPNVLRAFMSQNPASRFAPRAKELLAARDFGSASKARSEGPEAETVRPVLQNGAEVGRALQKHYPPVLRDAGIGGTVNVWMFIYESGEVLKSQVGKSSGYDALDEAALLVSYEMQFSPARSGNSRVPVWVAMDVTFEVQ